MDNIYLVTSGEYSDYGIHAAFSTEKKAQAYIESSTGISVYGDAPEIEIWPIDNPKCVCRMSWHVTVCANGKFGPRVFEYPEQTEGPIRTATYRVTGRAGGIHVTSYVSAEHALKVAAEEAQAILRAKVAPSPSHLLGDVPLPKLRSMLRATTELAGPDCQSAEVLRRAIEKMENDDKGAADA